MKLSETLEKELNKQFPKGDKARGRALVLFALAQQEIKEAEEKGFNLAHNQMAEIERKERVLKIIEATPTAILKYLREKVKK